MLEVKEFTYVNIRVVFLLLRLRLLSTDVDGTVAERTYGHSTVVLVLGVATEDAECNMVAMVAAALDWVA